MPGVWNWEQEVSRRLSLRDLNIVFGVAEHGSMAKAALRLGVTQSAISQVVASIEGDLGVRLFDRSRRGVEPTIYGTALIERARAAFDELRSGLLEIDDLKNEGTGEIRIGCPETLAASVLPTTIETFASKWPNVRLDVETFYGGATAEKLRDRSVDVAFVRGGPGLEALAASGEFDIIRLFEDQLNVVVGTSSKWAQLSTVDLVDLADAPWIVLPYGWGEEAIPNAFKQKGLAPPRIAIKTFSVHLRLHLVAGGTFVTALPTSILRLYKPHFALKELPIHIPNTPYDVAIVTTKNRTRRRIVDLFIESTTGLFSGL